MRKLLFYCLIFVFSLVILIPGCSRRIAIEEEDLAFKKTPTPTPLATEVTCENLKDLIKKQEGDVQSAEFMFNATGRKTTGMPTFQKGKIIFRMPGDVRMELNIDDQKLLVQYYSDQAFTYDRANNSLTKLDLARLPDYYIGLIMNSNPVSYLLGRNIKWENVEILGTEKINELECYVLKLKPARIPWMEEIGEISSEKVWLGKESGLSYKVIMYNPIDQPVMTYEFSDVLVNVGSDDSLFIPDVPEGTRVYNITDQVLEKIKEREEKSPEKG